MVKANTQVHFEEPAVLLGETRLRDGSRRLYLPVTTVNGHTLVVSRSGGGKSHTLATLALGLAKTAAVRRLNLSAERDALFSTENVKSPKNVNQSSNELDPTETGLVEVMPNYPPLSVCVFDPHRDLAKRLLEDLAGQIASVRLRRRHLQEQEQEQLQKHALPKNLVPQTIPKWEDLLEEMLTYIDLGDRQHVFGLNLLDTAMWESKENCASTLIEIFRRIYPDAWGSRMEDCFRHSVFALYLLNTYRHRDMQFTILDIVPFITIDLWREALLDHPVIDKENPVIAAWWKIQFADKMSDNFRNEVIKPVLNKLNPFVGSAILSRIFGQSRTTLDFEPLLRGGNIILIDLAASEIETENCALAGAILIGFLLKKARHIADSIGREADRPLVQLMVDEFQVILAAPYADIMGQYRKWGVRATLATQSLTLLDELDPTLRPLVMANAANLMVLQVNAEDAEYLRRELVADSTTGSGSKPTGLVGSPISPSAGGGGIGPDLYDLVNAGRGVCYFKGTFDHRREQVFTVYVAPRPFQQALDKQRTSQSPYPSRTQSQSKSSYSKDPFEAARQLILEGVLERNRQHYTRPAPSITLELNQKQQDYLQLYRLEGLDFQQSVLLNGFVSWQTELAASLERRTKLAQLELETNKVQRVARRSVRRSKSRPSDEGDNTNNTSDNDANDSSKLTSTGGSSQTESRRANQPSIQILPASPILPFAPDFTGKPPVRHELSPSQLRKETGQLPDGVDYRPEAQVKKLRQKEKARKQRNNREFYESLQVRQKVQERVQTPPSQKLLPPPSNSSWQEV